MRSASLTKAFVIFSLLFFYFFDISNIDGLRQGTEGFYLQITKEMAENQQYLTPQYLGTKHWSKPPLHFWLPQAFYLLSDNYLLWGRISILLCSLFCLFIISRWFSRELKYDPFTTLVFFLSTFGLLKYSRIYMMEIPLSMLTFIGILYFWSYSKDKSLKSFSLSVFFLSLSSLVKGPVSLVTAFGGLFTYSLFVRRLNLIRPIFIVGISVGLFSSLWFIFSYFEHGMTFINQFFLRENLGKFSAKSYPLSSPIMGLVIYGLPLSLYLLCSLTYGKKVFVKSNFNKYIFIHFLVFFIVWCIPSQRSHHYAIPALPFMISLFLIFFHQKCFNDKSFHILDNLFRIIGCGVSIVILLALYLKGSPDLLTYFSAILTVALLLFFFFPKLLQTRKTISTILLWGLFSAHLWSVVANQFVLPLIPQKSVLYLDSRDVGVVYRKPFYVQERLKNTIHILSPEAVKNDMMTHNRTYLMLESVYLEREVSKVANILMSWPVWKRGRQLRHVLKAIREGDLSSLQERMLIVERRPQEID